MYKIDSFMKLFAPFSVVVTLFKKYTIPLIQFDGFYLSIGNPRQRLAPREAGSGTGRGYTGMVFNLKSPKQSI